MKITTDQLFNIHVPSLRNQSKHSFVLLHYIYVFFVHSSRSLTAAVFQIFIKFGVCNYEAVASKFVKTVKKLCIYFSKVIHLPYYGSMTINRFYGSWMLPSKLHIYND